MVDSSGRSGHTASLKNLLAARNVSRSESQPGLSELPDEALLANIATAAERISQALYKNEPLVIFGHDDPDGVTSTYILYQFFNSCGYQKHNYFIPNRNLEPHGIQPLFVDFVRRGGYTLAITVDNGIASTEGVESLRNLGCDTIIADHHLIQPEQLPAALAIVNPQLPDCRYPYKDLAGVGVVLMLIRYLARFLEHPVSLSSYFWTAIGSIADKVPMTGINRVLVRHVIDNWSALSDPSVDFLLRNHNRVDGPMDVFNFLQATARLIANGREEGGQHTALRFLLERGEAKAKLFQNMESQKNKWESELNRIFGFLDTLTTGYEGNAFIYYDDEDMIPYSLLGTACTYILGKLGIPTILLKTHNGDIVCEGRCGEGFNMVEAFRHCKAYLKQYGGHVKAAGFTLEASQYDGFLECYCHYLGERLPNTPSLADSHPDAALPLDGFTEENWLDLEFLLPFGQQNPEPRILIENILWDELQQAFNLEYGSQQAQPGKRGNALVHWKGRGFLRVLSFVETGAAN